MVKFTEEILNGKLVFLCSDKKGSIPILWPKLMINDNGMEQAESLKFLRVLPNENVCCKELIKDIENS